jgi:hypothetical protein
LLVCLILTQAGCVWIALGATGCGILGYSYWRGKVCHAYVADLPDALSAARTALAELGMQVEKEEVGKCCATLKTRAADGTKIRIHLEREMSKIPAEGPVTKIGVRVGCFGDHPLSGRILYQISAHLVPMVPPGIEPPPRALPGPAPVELPGMSPPINPPSQASNPPANPGSQAVLAPATARPDLAH